MTLPGGSAASRPRVYIGESVNLQRRLAGNYRSPGPSQQTNVRINALLGRHLAAGGTVGVAVATSAALWLDGTEHPLGLSRKDARLFAENAALVFAHVTDDADIENL
jgi:hypothetical protein